MSSDSDTSRIALSRDESGGGMKDVEQVYGDACKEIQRRKDAALTETTTSAKTFFPRTKNGSSFPKDYLSDQKWVLLTLGTPVLAPLPSDPLRPVMRVYGAFQTKEEGRAHCEEVRKADGSCSLLLVKRAEWILLPSDEESRDNPSVNERRVKQTLQRERERRAQEDIRFREAVETKSYIPSQTSMETEAERKEREEEEEDAEREVYPPPSRLSSRAAEVRGHSFLAMNCIPDKEKGECLVRVLACFSTAEEAEEWTQNFACREFPDHDIMIAQTCEWLSPNGGTSASRKTLYPNSELQKIMDASERNATSVRDYKEVAARERSEGAEVAPGEDMEVDEGA